MAVYTKLTISEISSHLQNYDLGKLVEFKEIIEGIDNSNFILVTEKNGIEQKFILTVFEARIDKTQLPFFINFKLHLAQKGICCPNPILNNFGVALLEIKKKKSIIASFLSGKTLQPEDDGCYSTITKNHCFEIGKILAKLHLAARDFSFIRENELGINGWKSLFSKFDHLVNDYEQNLREEILENLNFLNNSWNFDLPSSAVHSDLFPDNVFFDKNEVSGVIDFYFAATDSLIYDFAITVNAWCFDEKNNFIEEKFDAMILGYELIRKFSDSEKRFLKIALIGASMRFLLTRLHDMFFTPKGSLVKIKNPQEYLQKLRFFRSKI